MSVVTRVAALAFLGGSVLPLLSAAPAAAVVVNVGGINYDLNSITSSASGQPTSFGLPPSGLMPWWGSDALASQFASEVFFQLGPGWDSDYGPVFAYAIDSSSNMVLGLAQSTTVLGDQIDVAPAATALVNYAIASGPLGAPPPVPVPAPVPILAMAAGWSWSRRLKSRLHACNPGELQSFKVCRSER